MTDDAQNAQDRAASEFLTRRLPIDALAERLNDAIDEGEEEIVYDAVDELRRRWHSGHVYGLASVNAEGKPVADPPAVYVPFYRTAIRDRDEFGRKVLQLKQRLRRLRRKLRARRG